jgi:hypothetical protein
MPLHLSLAQRLSAAEAYASNAAACSMLVDILLLLVLFPVSFIVSGLAHELGHAIAGKLVGLSIHRIVIATDLRKKTVKPRFTLAGTEFYFAPNSLLHYVTTSGVAFSKHPVKQLIFNLAGPLSGALTAAVFAFYSFGFTGTTVVNGIAICLWGFHFVMNLLELQPELLAYDTPSDGWNVREAWRRIKASKKN